MMEKHKITKKTYNFVCGIFCFLTILLCHPLTLSSQTKTNTRTISGVVFDQGGIELPGVSVSLTGTMSTMTDANGKYSISVPANAKELTFSFIGFGMEKVKISDSPVINVTLKESASDLQEVLVVGYGVQKKESSAASISQVKGSDLLKASTSNIANALSGQISGLSTVQSSGQPGADASKIYIRGVSSWVGSDPLVMVDGVERSFNDIDPNEIENISVLKDAAVTAVYGVRGANGVILITTKRGQKGDVKVDATADYTIKQPIGMIAPLDSYTTGLVMNEAYKNDNNWGSLLSDEVLQHYKLQDLPYLYPNTNWQRELLKDNTSSQHYNVNISGGTDFTRVFASISYLSEGDIIKTVKQPTYDPEYRYDRYNYRFNIDTDLTRTTVLSLDAGGYLGIRNSPFETNNIRVYRPIFMLGPMDIPLYYPSSVLDLYPDKARSDEVGQRIASTGKPNSENPYIANNYSGSRTLKTTNLNATIKLAQKLDFITKGLLLNVKASYNNTSTYEKTFAYSAISYSLSTAKLWTRYNGRDGTLDAEAPQTPGVANRDYLSGAQATWPRSAWYYEGSLSYARKFGRHDITGLFVAQKEKTQDNVEFPHFRQGVVGRFTYDFDQKYLLESSVGYNGSEQFSPSKRYGLFPSLALGWNLHNEKFFQPITPIISKAKVRASYGIVGFDGSDNPNNARWLYTSSYLNGNTGNKFRPGTATQTGPTITSILEDAAANINATWETSTEKNLGFELNFLPNSLFVLNVDFFHNNRENILLDRQSVPAWFGIGLKQQNLGATETKGYDIDLKFQDRVNANLYYWIKPMFSFSDNRILSRDEPLFKPEYQKQAGKRINQLVGYHSVGNIQNADDQMNSIRYGSGIMGLGDTQWVDLQW